MTVDVRSMMMMMMMLFRNHQLRASGLTTSHYVCIVARLVVVRDESEEVL